MVGIPPQQLEKRLGSLADLEWGKFGKIDGDDRAERNRHQKGNARTNECSRHQYHDSEMGIVKERRPLCGGQEILEWHVLKENPGFLDQDKHDTQRRRDGHQGCGKQQSLDEGFPDIAGVAFGESRTDLVRHGHGQNSLGERGGGHCSQVSQVF